jgi:hypothetical protein
VRHTRTAAILGLLALLCAGCSAGPGPVAAMKHKGGPPAIAADTRPDCVSGGPYTPRQPVRRSGTPWPQRLLLRQRPAELISDQVAAPATGTDYALISRTHTPMRGRYVLECTRLRGGPPQRGPSFPVGNLASVAGYLWVYGSLGSGLRPVISQVSPVTLARIRSIPLPQAPFGYDGIAVAPGAGGSVWIGSDRTLLRADVATGAVLNQVTLPPGLVVSDAATGPAGATLYVSAARVVRHGTEGLVMLEYDARSGRMAARASSGLLRYSVSGADLTAVPRGVWVSFRTGMLGLTIHLKSNGLRMVAPPGLGTARQPATGVFHWAMSEAASYGGGALWLASLSVVACLDPQTGKIRASERIGRSPESANQVIDQIEAIDPASRTMDGLGIDGPIQVTPPRRCWR